jgi:hypothetical protein
MENNQICSLCEGNGIIREYDYYWNCPNCNKDKNDMHEFEKQCNEILKDVPTEFHKVLIIMANEVGYSETEILSYLKRYVSYLLPLIEQYGEKCYTNGQINIQENLM